MGGLSAWEKNLSYPYVGPPSEVVLLVLAVIMAQQTWVVRSWVETSHTLCLRV